jgi:hypothetical protein
MIEWVIARSQGRRPVGPQIVIGQERRNELVKPAVRLHVVLLLLRLISVHTVSNGSICGIEFVFGWLSHTFGLQFSYSASLLNVQFHEIARCERSN